MDRGDTVREELFLQNLTAFAAFRHGVNVHISEGMTRRAVRGFGEDWSLVFEDVSEKQVLNVLPPERLPVIFFEITNAVP